MSHSTTTPPSLSSPPPSIGKIGPYTVFVTPPTITTPIPTTTTTSAAAVRIPKNPKTAAPPVQPPPIQYPTSAVDRFAFLRHALVKLQNVHASVDEYMANWLGLDQSKYQWALNDYYEAKGLEKGDVLTKEIANKSQTV
ncbi:hypothetical protein RND81_06G169200 [Saponaria officinalis]|uniref:Uncharacterized protein n=1 Tax=Saponaria officinalis TaxID=3572 RepID=A0AAW1KAZ8_SAPOF